jgi:phosphate acetyltransferase
MISIREKASKLNKTVVLAEGEEERTVKAAEAIVSNKIANIILLGDEKVIKSKYPDVNLKGITIINPKTDVNNSKYINLLYELRKSKGMTEEQAKVTALNPLYYGVLMVKNGDADGMVAGALCSTGDTLRPALQIIKMPPTITCVSSCFIMVMPENCKYGENGIMVFGDCAVNPNPDSQQLAAIAIASADTAKRIAGISPKIAMLSFSTKGSAKHELVDKVVAATKIAKELAPDLLIDGELQADASLVESVGKLKSPGSPVAGHANTLIFPDLQAGNIGYKLVQRLAGADAIGPIIQGLAKPVNDLSRGCSVQDIIDVVAITALQVKD